MDHEAADAIPGSPDTESQSRSPVRTESDLEELREKYLNDYSRKVTSCEIILDWPLVQTKRSGPHLDEVLDTPDIVNLVHDPLDEAPPASLLRNVPTPPYLRMPSSEPTRSSSRISPPIFKNQSVVDDQHLSRASSNELEQVSMNPLSHTCDLQPQTFIAPRIRQGMPQTLQVYPPRQALHFPLPSESASSMNAQQQSSDCTAPSLSSMFDATNFPDLTKPLPTMAELQRQRPSASTEQLARQLQKMEFMRHVDALRVKPASPEVSTHVASNQK